MKGVRIVLIAAALMAAIFVALNMLSGLVPGIRVNLDGLGDSELASTVGRSWMQSEPVLKSRIANDLRQYMESRHCSSAQCLQGFGFDGCVGSHASIICRYVGELVITNPKEAIHSPRAEALSIAIEVRIERSKVTVISAKRAGTSMVF